MPETTSNLRPDPAFPPVRPDPPPPGWVDPLAVFETDDPCAAATPADGDGALRGSG